MFVDPCEHCKSPIYSDDEIVADGLDNYHVECAELIDVGENETDGSAE